MKYSKTATILAMYGAAFYLIMDPFIFTGVLLLFIGTDLESRWLSGPVLKKPKKGGLDRWLNRHKK